MTKDCSCGKDPVYIAIDLKSFYATVECLERKLDPLNTNLVVADVSRTEKTICLAVSPSLKRHGISGRARLFEVVQRVREVNAMRSRQVPGRKLSGSSVFADQLDADPALAVDYIAAPPRMALYMKYSSQVYRVYLKYVAPEDMHVYSIDEVFMDVTSYLKTSGLTAHEFAKRILQDVKESIGITATAGIGTNLYLCKVAMDIGAKHVEPDEDGARIAYLDERRYRKSLWNHYPLTDFWRVGHGYRTKLEEHGLFTMGDIARCSLGGPGDYHNEELLYKLFGVNAELLIDHAWGWEPCTMKEIKTYRPQSTSVGSGQVLQCPYDYIRGKLIVREMTDLLVLDLVDKGLVTDQMVLTVGYDIENLSDPERAKSYQGPVTTDHFGRRTPKHAHGSVNLDRQTSSTKVIMDAVMDLYDRIVDPRLLVRRVNLVANHTVPFTEVKEAEVEFEQMDLFTDYTAREQQRLEEEETLAREKRMQQAVLDIKKKYGKNAILKGMNLQEGAMTRERNGQIGGHKA